MKKISHRLRIFLVDDNNSFLYAAKMLLTTIPEAEVVGMATTAEAALQEIPKAEPNLVLMDFSMPGMNGIEAIRRITSFKRPPWVALVTLHDSPDYRAMAMKGGAICIISKVNFAVEIPALLNNLAQMLPTPANFTFAGNR